MQKSTMYTITGGLTPMDKSFIHFKWFWVTDFPIEATLWTDETVTQTIIFTNLPRNVVQADNVQDTSKSKMDGLN